MRSNIARHARSSDLRRSIERLEALPIRPATARFLFDRLAAESERAEVDEPHRPAASGLRSPTVADLDPGWILSGKGPTVPSELERLVDLSWWPVPPAATADALHLLWRNSVAMALAARRIAHEARDPGPIEIGQAALLSRLGLWAWVLIDPTHFSAWLAEPDVRRRISLERESLGSDSATIGLRLAERWGCAPLVADAIWMADQPEEAEGGDPRLHLIRQAGELVARTPWALTPSGQRESGVPEPRTRLLIAEVQARCGGPLVDADATAREERITRDNARLRLDLARRDVEDRSRRRFVSAYIETGSIAEPEVWAERASLAWCDEPGVAAARVIWIDDATEPAPTHPSQRPPSIVLPISDRGRELAEIQLWTDSPVALDLASHPTRAAWSVWAGEVAARARLLQRLDSTLISLRNRSDRTEPELRLAKLDALGEFAGGAGHELNNPLAVILGRAQLLMAKQTDPDALRSLRAIITQAQRTNRILRDLMYFARPSEPRPKVCQPDEILRNSVRDLQGDAETRGVRLIADLRHAGPAKAWADPDPLRQVADCLIRNALEATPAGGQVVASSSGEEDGLVWTVKDSGQGVSPHESLHLFDPFFCGRQAGRGLGLGLPRVARIVERLGGKLEWNSTQGRGTAVQVRLPLAEMPGPVPIPGPDPANQARIA